LLLYSGADNNPFNLAFKDPLMWQSDDWDFPTNKFPTIGWLGRVHRGTPWQTVYLKASDVLGEFVMIGSATNYNIGINTWINWTGNANSFDATNTAPVQDRLLFDLFTTAFNDNATRGQLPINVGPTNENLAAWSALFSGVMVLSNNASDYVVQTNMYVYPPSPPPYIAQPIQPAGVNGMNSPLGRLVVGINNTRANFTRAAGLVGAFEHVGDILSVPQFTEQSPFLNLSSSIQRTNGISDEMYEWLPQQTLSLLRVSGSPRYVIYCYGQALKPAPNSIVTSGPLFGMVANYQVVSEIATRAVVRFGSTVTNIITTDITGNWISMPMVTNNNAVIESFNILPPD
jgi:hypothetical protein